MNDTAFTSEQTEYLKGFFTGVSQRKDIHFPFAGVTNSGLLTSNPEMSNGINLASEHVHGVSIDELSKEEVIKFEKHGLDVWDDILSHADRNMFPEGGNVFRWKFHGLFYVSPAQEALMLRCRVPAGLLASHQMRALGKIADDFGGGYAHITTRANIQIREIMPRDTVRVLVALRDCGLTSQGAGADNIRNITASPTSGFDPHEIYDVIPLAKAMHHYILNTRDMYDLPRKFNISFDGGGLISSCTDTNDIGFYAVRSVGNPGEIRFRVFLAGISGHRQLAFDCGLALKPEQCVAVAAAMIRVFRQNGDRTNRKKARLKYLIDSWGQEKFLEKTQKSLEFPLEFIPSDQFSARPDVEMSAHTGIHSQREPGFNYIGINIPVGRLTPNQMIRLAELSDKYGRGELRLTVWQNILIPHIHDKDINSVVSELGNLDLSISPSPVGSGIIACTGNRGCKYSSTDTKGHAMQITGYLTGRLSIDPPVNIHITGCPHSCAQHYCGDIGLIGVKIRQGDQSVEGYNVVAGGGVDNKHSIARKLKDQVPADQIHLFIESCLEKYLSNRLSNESFHSFVSRMTDDELINFFTDESSH